MSPITGPPPYAGKRVIVVGAGDSAAQVANELAPLARVTLAARHPLRFIPQRIGGKDVHYWLRETGFDSLPAEWLNKITGGSVITDSVGFQRTLADGLLDVRPVFTGLDGDGSSGTTTSASGSMRSSWPPATALASATSATWAPWTQQAHRCTQAGYQTTHLGLVYLGLEYQRSFASNTLRGVGADASAVIAPLVAWIDDAPRTIGLTTPQIHLTLSS